MFNKTVFALLLFVSIPCSAGFANYDPCHEAGSPLGEDTFLYQCGLTAGSEAKEGLSEDFVVRQYLKRLSDGKFCTSRIDLNWKGQFYSFESIFSEGLYPVVYRDGFMGNPRISPGALELSLYTEKLVLTSETYNGDSFSTEAQLTGSGGSQLSLQCFTW